MTEPLVARLRGVLFLSLIDDMQAIVDEAATELARLQAENEALRRERDELARMRADKPFLERLTAAGVTPEAVTEIAAEMDTIEAQHKAQIRAVASYGEAAEAKAARLEEALGKVREKAQAGMTPSAGLTREDRALAACSFIEEMSRAALEAK